VLLELFFFALVGGADGVAAAGGDGGATTTAGGAAGELGRGALRPARGRAGAALAVSLIWGCGRLALGSGAEGAIASSGSGSLGGVLTRGAEGTAGGGALISSWALGFALAAVVASEPCMTVKAAHAPPPRINSPPPSNAAISGALLRFGKCVPVLDQVTAVERPTCGAACETAGGSTTNAETGPVTSATGMPRAA